MPLTRSEARNSHTEEFSELKDPEPPKSKTKARRPTLETDIAQDEEYTADDSYEIKANKKIIKAKKSLLKGEEERAPADALQQQEGQIGTIIEDRDLARENPLGWGKARMQRARWGEASPEPEHFKIKAFNAGEEVPEFPPNM
ncbi:hypothetical protein KCU65_g1284, partial [Aureobasidium melanogenum]